MHLENTLYKHTKKSYKMHRKKARFDVDCLIECYLLFNQQKIIKITPESKNEGKKQTNKQIKNRYDLELLRLERNTPCVVGWFRFSRIS